MRLLAYTLFTIFMILIIKGCSDEPSDKKPPLETVDLPVRGETKSQFINGQKRKFVYTGEKWLMQPKSLHATIDRKNRKINLSLEKINSASKYLLYISTTPIETTQTLQLPKSVTKVVISQPSYQIDAADIEGLRYLAFSVSNNDFETDLSEVYTIGVYQNFATDGIHNTSIDIKIPTRKIEEITPILVQSQSGTFVRTFTQGYQLDATAVEKEQNTYLKFSNPSPRHFAEINFAVGEKAYRINTHLPPFSYKIFDFPDWQLDDSSQTLKFLDPKPLYNPNVSIFGNSNNKHTSATIKAYHILQSGLKSMYTLSTVRDGFMDFFSRIRKESTSTVNSKWHNVLTNNTAKDHRVYVSSACGASAAGIWLTINWCMSRFINWSGRDGAHAYTTYSHEHAHTLRYNHNSGLAYGWDDYVKKYVGELLTTNKLPYYEVDKEKANVFWLQSGNSLIPYSNTPEVAHINNLDLYFYKNGVNRIYLNNNILVIDPFFSHSHALLLTADNISNTSTATGTMSAYIMRDWGKSEHDIDIVLNIPSRNFSQDSPTQTGVYFTVPQQEAVIKSNATHRGGWYIFGQSALTIVVKNEQNTSYHLPLRAGNGAFTMNSGVLKGQGSVYFIVDKSQVNLPKGTYTGSFKIHARGWHNPSYFNDNIKVFIKYDVR